MNKAKPKPRANKPKPVKPKAENNSTEETKERFVYKHTFFCLNSSGQKVDEVTSNVTLEKEDDAGAYFASYEQLSDKHKGVTLYYSQNFIKEKV